MINEKILTDAGCNYKYNFEVLRPFRDKIIEKELTECFKRALIEDYGKPAQDKILQNLRKMQTDWENNGALKKDGISSATKYRKVFQTDPQTIKEEDTLLYKLRNNCSKILENYKKHGGSKKPLGSRISEFLYTKKGKWTIAGAAAVAVGGLGYVGYKKGYFTSKKESHLSCIG